MLAKQAETERPVDSCNPTFPDHKRLSADISSTIAGAHKSEAKLASRPENERRLLPNLKLGKFTSANFAERCLRVTATSSGVDSDTRLLHLVTAQHCFPMVILLVVLSKSTLSRNTSNSTMKTKVSIFQFNFSFSCSMTEPGMFFDADVIVVQCSVIGRPCVFAFST